MTESAHDNDSLNDVSADIYRVGEIVFNQSKEPEMNIETSLDTYVQKAYRRVFNRMRRRGLIPRSATPEQNGARIQESSRELSLRTLGFVRDSDEMCQIWHGEGCTADREKEKQVYGNVRVLKVKCIDGRKPRGIEGEADSLKTEAARISLDDIDSTGELIPQQTEVCDVLSDMDIVPLEISLAHFDSLHPDHGCAAIKLALEDLEGINEDVWSYLTPKEIALVLEARSDSQEDANLALLELTNIRAFTNMRNQALEDHGLPPMERVGLVALFDTRTMGIEVRFPVVKKNEVGEYKYVPASEREILSTTVLSERLKEEKTDSDRSSLPEFGSLREDFVTPAGFERYSRALTELTDKLFEPENYFTDSESERDALHNAVKNIKAEVQDFISRRFADLTPDQAVAFEYRLLRAVAHQYLTGLSTPQKHHPFSDHEERYISISQDANYPGKYVVKDQSFRMSSPNSKTGAKRIDISASVMDNTGVDQGKPHILFISTSISREDYDRRDTEKMGARYGEAVNKNVKFFRELTSEKTVKNRISKGNIMPIGVLVDQSTGEVLEIVQENMMYI